MHPQRLQHFFTNLKEMKAVELPPSIQSGDLVSIRPLGQQRALLFQVLSVQKHRLQVNLTPVEVYKGAQVGCASSGPAPEGVPFTMGTALI